MIALNDVTDVLNTQAAASRMPFAPLSLVIDGGGGGNPVKMLSGAHVGGGSGGYAGGTLNIPGSRSGSGKRAGMKRTSTLGIFGSGEIHTMPCSSVIKSPSLIPSMRSARSSSEMRNGSPLLAARDIG